MAQEEEKFSKRLDDKFSPAAIKKREEFQPFGGHLGTIVFLGVIWLIMNIWAAVYIGKSRNILGFITKNSRWFTALQFKRGI